MPPNVPLLLRRAAAELALLLAAGIFLGVLGPFGTAERALVVRMTYWPTVIVGGGVIGIAVDAVLGRRLAGFWTRLLADTAAMTVPVSLFVWVVSQVMLNTPLSRPHFVELLYQVFVISLAVMGLRQLAWRSVWTERATPEAGPIGEAPDSFRKRLSARRRQARLLAVEAEDHYLRIHTDAGAELITLRIGDAVEELAALPGFRTHRSWWVSAEAIEAIRWRRGRGELRLTGGLVVPVSRTNASALKDAGWF
jgi:DNA-binding LytR/AlgR family response regulator